MAPSFSYSIADVENGIRVREPLTSRWLASVLEGTDVEVSPSAQGLLEASLTMSGRSVLVSGKVQASVLMPCARCLQPASVAIECDLILHLVPDAPPKGRVQNAKAVKNAADPHAGKGNVKGTAKKDAKKDAKDSERKRRRGKAVEDDDDDGRLMDADEADFDTYSGDDVVLDDFVREAILLELPMFPLCSETCPGIGAPPSETAESATEDSPIDPRLAPLMELKSKSKA